MKSITIPFLLLSVIQVRGASVGLGNDKTRESLERAVLDELERQTAPLLQAAAHLQRTASSYRLRRVQAESSIPLTEFDIDTEACNELSDTLLTAGRLAWNATLDVYRITLNVTDSLADLTNCIGWNPIDTAKCYVDGITGIIDSVKSVKPVVAETLDKIWAMSSKLEPEFLACIGDGPTTTPTTTTTLPTTTTTQPTTREKSWWPF